VTISAGHTAEQHQRQIGILTLSWSSVHNQLFWIYVNISGRSYEDSRDMFFSKHADTQQRGLVRKAANNLDPYPDLLAEVVSILTELDSLSLERNAIIHGMWDMDPATNTICPAPHVRPHEALRLDSFEQQVADLIYALAVLWHRAWHVRLQATLIHQGSANGHMDDGNSTNGTQPVAPI
jgi:hypothetical protein